MKDNNLEDAEDQFLQKFQDIDKEFSQYQKVCGDDYKSRAQKRKERVLKLTTYLHNAEQKKERKK